MLRLHESADSGSASTEAGRSCGRVQKAWRAGEGGGGSGAAACVKLWSSVMGVTRVWAAAYNCFLASNSAGAGGRGCRLR